MFERAVQLKNVTTGTESFLSIDAHSGEFVEVVDSGKAWIFPNCIAAYKAWAEYAWQLMNRGHEDIPYIIDFVGPRFLYKHPYMHKVPING